MKVIGNIKTANKFYIINSRGSIEWVPTLETAKRYALNPQNKEWYNKDIYATNERIIKNKLGINTLESQTEKKYIDVKTLKQAFNDFKQQTTNYLESKLQEFAKNAQYDSIITMISWKNSTIELYKQDAEQAIKYRDNLYNYHFTNINSLQDKIKHDELNQVDLSEYYTQYIENFPSIE